MLLRYSEAVVRRIQKIRGKATVSKSLFWQSCRSIKKETSTKLLWILRFFLSYFFIGIPEIIGSFFKKSGSFCCSCPVFKTMNTRHVDKSSKQQETAIILTKYSCKRDHYENSIFYALSLWRFVA